MHTRFAVNKRRRACQKKKVSTMSAIPSCSVHHVKMFVDAFSTSCRLQRHIPPATDENVGQFVLVNGKCSSIIFSRLSILPTRTFYSIWLIIGSDGLMNWSLLWYNVCIIRDVKFVTLRKFRLSIKRSIFVFI